MEDLSAEAKSCSEQGNGFPFCYPTTIDNWKNGTTHDFIWNWNYPYYVEADNLNLYLYYYIKYEYILVKTFSNLNRSLGGFEVTVDDTWFLSKSETNQNLTIYGYYLPSTLNNTEELTNTYSMYPRPFNFTVSQIASPGNGTNSTTGDGNNSTTTTTTTTSQSNGSSSSNLPGWAIAVIVIACIAFICGVAALVWTFLLSRRNTKNNKLIPIFGQNNNNNNSNQDRGIEAAVMKEKFKDDSLSLNSQAKMMAFRSTDSVGENASSVKTYIQHDQPTKLSSSDAVMLADTFRNTLNRSVSDWEEDPEVKRRRLGEALLQRQLEEDGTFVQNAGRLTRVRSLADIPKSAVFEQPKY